MVQHTAFMNTPGIEWFHCLPKLRTPDTSKGVNAEDPDSLAMSVQILSIAHLSFSSNISLAFSIAARNMRWRLSRAWTKEAAASPCSNVQYVSSIPQNTSRYLPNCSMAASVMFSARVNMSDCRCSSATRSCSQGLSRSWTILSIASSFQ
jgi:hypothetical protein